MSEVRWVEGEMCYGCRGPISQPKTGRRRKYCSNACRQKRYRRRKKWQNYETWEEKQRRLGDERAAEAVKQYGELPWEVTYRISRGIPVFPCRECGRPYAVMSVTGPMPLYCSAKCRNAHLARRQAIKHKLEGLAEDIKAREARGDPAESVEKDRERYREVIGALARGERVQLCQWCRMPFPPRTTPGREKVFCSARCKKAAWESARRRCRECGRRFAVKDKDGKRTRGRYCSTNCQHKGAARANWRREERGRRERQKAWEKRMRREGRREWM